MQSHATAVNNGTESLARKRAAYGASVGTLIEYYDYYLYGLAAATIFPKVFFPGHDVTMAQLASFASFAVGFLLRPLGGIVFGHIGDRVGRKAALMITVIGMGLATAAIGLIPSAQHWGALSPLLLIVCRSFQGLFVGGEMGGAATLIVEHAPPGKRGFYGSLLIVGAGIANVLSAGLMALLARNQTWFLDWGWRLPFLFSLVLVLIATVLRSRIEESDEFKQRQRETQRGQQKRRAPLFEAIVKHPKNVVLGILMGLVQSIAGYVILTFGLSLVVKQGVSPQVGFIGTFIVGILQIFMAPAWGALSDRIGRRTLYIAAAIALAVFVYPVLLLYQTKEPMLIWLGMVIGFVIPGVAMQATFQTMLTEMFDVAARTTGVGLGYQLSNVFGGGFAPMICVALVASAGGAVWPVLIYVSVIAAVSVLATIFASLRPDHAIK
ncbi:MFS transporter [Robbsia sp. KACC 23696]|uniref:MFS transporter n=1 Tax=Robbsia sp. KACC 23696 TaxID=3149231 RepID=UPI00325A8012